MNNTSFLAYFIQDDLLPTTHKGCNTKDTHLSVSFDEKSLRNAHTPQPMSYRKYTNIVHQRSFLEKELAQKSTGYSSNSCPENRTSCLGKRKHCCWTSHMDTTSDSWWTPHLPFPWFWWAHRGLLSLSITSFWAVGRSRGIYKKSGYVHCETKTSYGRLSHWFLLD